MNNPRYSEISPCATLSRDDKNAEVKASSPIRTSLFEREGSIWGSLKRLSLRRRDRNPDIVKASRSDDSDLCHEMISKYGFTQEQMHHAAERFHLGRSKSGKTIYWMIDDLGRCLDGHLGCASHDPDSWVSTLLKARYPEAAPYVHFAHCFFGLHQISEYDSIYETHPDPLMGRGYLNERATGGAVKPQPWRGQRGLGFRSKPLLKDKKGLGLLVKEEESCKSIGLVESERSAVILSELCPDLLWLAYSYPLNCTIDHFEPLQGRKITFFPRTDPSKEIYVSFLELADRVKRAYPNIDISVSHFLEDHATADQKSRCIDLLDFLCESP